MKENNSGVKGVEDKRASHEGGANELRFPLPTENIVFTLYTKRDERERPWTVQFKCEGARKMDRFRATRENRLGSRP